MQVVPVWAWPEHLLRVRPLAPALYVRGDARLLWRTGTAIVGPREADESARAWAFELAARSSADGELVISGGARGIDTAAHLGALSSGRTVAYIGAPTDAIYPRHNKALFERLIAEGHAIVSELLPGDFTGRAAHMARNRFIAAHAREVYIAEADIVSGSLGTAAYATDYGVPIIVSPPGIGVRRSGLDLLVENDRARIGAT